MQDVQVHSPLAPSSVTVTLIAPFARLGSPGASAARVPASPLRTGMLMVEKPSCAYCQKIGVKCEVQTAFLTTELTVVRHGISLSISGIPV
jgi:hypothetical protein